MCWQAHDTKTNAGSNRTKGSYNYQANCAWTSIY